VIEAQMRYHGMYVHAALFIPCSPCLHNTKIPYQGPASRQADASYIRHASYNR
jgi:hypothetical protein